MASKLASLDSLEKKDVETVEEKTEEKKDGIEEEKEKQPETGSHLQ